MAFRLKSFEVNDSTYQSNKVQLVDDNKDTSNNYFSLIVGNNGTGKSQLLRSIVNTLRGRTKSTNSDLFTFSSFETVGTPNKIIALTNSFTDKFPMNRHYSNSRSFNYKDDYYTYLGTKGGLGSASSFLIRRAMDILIENYSNKEVSKCLRYVFDYLEYKPLIELTYKSHLKERSSYNKERSSHNNIFGKDIISPNDLIDYLDQERNINNYTYRTREENYYQLLKEKYIDIFPEICDFLNETELLKKNSEYKIIIDFSNSNIQKLSKDISKYTINVRIYEILDFLRKIKVIPAFSVKVFKSKGDDFFSFDETSSGEANILVTMISLVPLLDDDCCVVIDEPEISLHPSWQYRYIELLMKVFEAFKGCHIIIASHSHFLVSDLPIEGSSVITLKRDGNFIKSELLPNSTFGWSAEDILLNIFDMPTSRNYYLSTIISEALELISKGEKDSKKFRDIKKKLVKFEPNMKEHDPLKLIIKTIFKVDEER